MTMRDVVIIGSGFGGAVMAARLAAALEAEGKSSPARVLVLEKGIDPSGSFDARSDGAALNAQGNRFRQTLDPKYLADIAELHTDAAGAYRPGTPSMNVISGKGLGGGSNVYDAVSLRAPSDAFEQTRDGARLWPAAYTRAALDPYYARVEAMLRVHRLAWTDASVPHWQLATKRDFVFAEGCRRIGLTAAPLKVATNEDKNEGWWNQGQRFEGRQSLYKNYLGLARDHGAEFWTGCDVQRIAPTRDGYVVSLIDRRGGGALIIDVECKLLIVAGGSVGSSALLLRSQDAFRDYDGARALSDQLGKRVSGNGDYGVSGTVGLAYEYEVQGFAGKPMSSFCPTLFAEHKFILIPFYAAPLYLTLGQPSTLLRPRDASALGRASTDAAAGERDWGAAYKERLATFGSRMLTMGCLAFDACEGEVYLQGDVPRVSWRETTRETEARWSKAVETMGRIYSALGGEMYLDTYRQGGTVNTAHPLGGCRMNAVVDDCGEVAHNPNLFVVDGAILPSALGVNPSLTIAAVAESIADRLLSGRQTRALGERL